MPSTNLRLIRLSPDRVVLKRGIHEILVSGGTALGEIVERVVELLAEGQGPEQILAAQPGDVRADVEKLLQALAQKGLLSSSDSGAQKEGSSDPLQAAFYANFGRPGLQAPERLRQARVAVFGMNLISRSLCRGLLECGVGRVQLISHPVLDNPRADVSGSSDESRLERLLEPPPEDELRKTALLCACSDLGEAGALLEVNRLGIRLGVPFLPAWQAEMLGCVGPLHFPRESACLRCYRLRLDSNSPKYDVGRAVRVHMTEDPVARESVGLLPPMPGVLGEIAAVECLKFLAEFMPADAIGRVIEINLISFSSNVRRVLRIPRCPDCSEQTNRAPMAVTRGPQIAQRE